MDKQRRLIDLVELRSQIKNGYYRVYTSGTFLGKQYIYIEDTENGECVMIGEVKKDDL